MQHHLNLPIVCRFQEDRIHVTFGFDARRFGLGCLGSADFAAVAAHVGIQRHILRFEWRDSNPALIQDPAQRRSKDAFAGMRSGSHDHQILHRCPQLTLSPNMALRGRAL